MRIASLLPVLGLFPSEKRLMKNEDSDPMRQFIETQYPIAKTGMLNNIGSKGAYAKEAKPGVLVSGGSTTPPGYRIT
jgi:hypothetical protein